MIQWKCAVWWLMLVGWFTSIISAHGQVETRRLRGEHMPHQGAIAMEARIRVHIPSEDDFVTESPRIKENERTGERLSDTNIDYAHADDTTKTNASPAPITMANEIRIGMPTAIPLSAVLEAHHQTTGAERSIPQEPKADAGDRRYVSFQDAKNKGV